MMPSACGRPARPSGNFEAWFEPKRFAVLLALLTLAAFPDVIFGSRTFFYRDFGIFGYPLAYYHRESFWQGEMPLWNPFNNCGLPFLAQWNTMILYPLSLFYVLFPLSWSLGVFCVLHLYLAGIGMYFLGFQWTGNRLAAAAAGIAFAFNGLTLSCLKWPNNMAALAWMPIVVLLAERAWRQGGRAIVLASLAAATQMLSGGPEIILFTWLIVSMLWLTQLFQGASFTEPTPSPLPGGEPATAASNEAPLLGGVGGGFMNRVQVQIEQGSLHKSGRDGFHSVPDYPQSVGKDFRDARQNQSVLCFARFIAVIILVTGLVSAQMLPFFDLLAHSQRDAAYSDASWAMPPWGWANFLVPLFRCFPSYHGVFAQQGQYWISSYYAGIGVLALSAIALAARRHSRLWLLAGMMIFSLVLSLGNEGYVYSVLSKMLPQLQIVRFPIKFVVIANFALPLLAAFGIAALWKRGNGIEKALPDAKYTELAIANTPQSPSSNDRKASLTPLLVLGWTCLMLIGAILWFARTHPLPTEQWSAAWQSGLSRGLFLVLILAASAGLSSVRSHSPSPVIGLGLVFLLWLDVMTHAPRLSPTIEPFVYQPGLAREHLKLDPERRLGHSRAMVSPLAEIRLNHLALTNAADDVLYSRLSLFANMNLLDSIPKVDGFFSLYLREENQVRSLLYAGTNASLAGLETLLGISQITAEDKVVHWKARTNFAALATIGQAPVFADAADTLRAIIGASFDPARTVYLPAAARAQTSATHSAEAKVKVTRISAHRIELDVDAGAPAWAVIAQTFHHSWKAFVDGAPSRLWRANYAFQAVEVPTGPHSVKLVYEDQAFRIGALVSVLTLLVCAGLWFRWRGKPIQLSGDRLNAGAARRYLDPIKLDPEP